MVQNVLIHKLLRCAFAIQYSKVRTIRLTLMRLLADWVAQMIGINLYGGISNNPICLSLIFKDV